jgi:hypothetical protein
MAIVALVTWVITAGFGFFMLFTWSTHGGLRRDTAGAESHFAPPMVLGHFLLAAAGLVVWVVYVVTNTNAFAWVAFADLVVVGVLGDLLVMRWAKDRRALSSAGSSSSGTLTGTAAATDLAEQHIPTPAVVLHGVFAVTTVVLVLLTALGVGNG